MRGGQLRHRVQIQARTFVVSASGEAYSQWAALPDTWARVSPASVADKPVAAQDGTDQAVIIRIRYRPGITTENRIVFYGRVYEIRGVRNWEERGVYLDLDCIVHQSDGTRGEK